MLFNRQKLLLALLESLGGSIGATDFQKHLFLFTRLFESERSFDFLPYKFGCYSFQAAADKRKMIAQEILLDDRTWTLTNKNISYSSVLSKGDQTRLSAYVVGHGKLTGKSLIRHVYKNYPYYAIRSEIVEEHLDDTELAIVAAAKPKKRRKSMFFTIGYEGQSIETYIDQLIQNDVRLLVDVRKNPLSRKYGFSKTALSGICESFGIAYLHIPSLGIPGDQRRNLVTQDDFDRLFQRYDEEVLPKNQASINQLVDLFLKHKRIALTCFERQHFQCHRDRVANAVVANASAQVTLSHI